MRCEKLDRIYFLKHHCPADIASTLDWLSTSFLNLAHTVYRLKETRLVRNTPYGIYRLCMVEWLHLRQQFLVYRMKVLPNYSFLSTLERHFRTEDCIDGSGSIRRNFGPDEGTRITCRSSPSDKMHEGNTTIAELCDTVDDEWVLWR